MFVVQVCMWWMKHDETNPLFSACEQNVTGFRDVGNAIGSGAKITKFPQWQCCALIQDFAAPVARLGNDASYTFRMAASNHEKC